MIWINFIRILLVSSIFSVVGINLLIHTKIVSNVLSMENELAAQITMVSNECTVKKISKQLEEHLCCVSLEQVIKQILNIYNKA